MPQIWMTYEELAALIDGDAAAARAAAETIPLDRRVSRDGRTRAKLNLPLTERFLERLVRQRLDREIAACAGDLAAMRDRMAARPTAAAPPVRVAARR